MFKRYCVISGILFTLVAVAHLLRIVYGWPVLIGDYGAPMWMSWVGLIIPGGLAVWAFRIAGKAE